MSNNTSKKEVHVSAGASELMAELFNRMPIEALKNVPEPIAVRIGDFMIANGYRIVFDRWYLQAEPRRHSETCAPPMTGEDFRRVFAPLPPEEAAALRECGTDAAADETETPLATATDLLRGWSVYNVASKELQQQTRAFLAAQPPKAGDGKETNPSVWPRLEFGPFCGCCTRNKITLGLPPDTQYSPAQLPAKARAPHPEACECFECRCPTEASMIKDNGDAP